MTSPGPRGFSPKILEIISIPHFRGQQASVRCPLRVGLRVGACFSQGEVMSGQNSQNPQEKRIDHWASHADEFEASAEAYSDLSDELGTAFLPVQQQAYESYCTWEAGIEAKTAERAVQGGSVVSDLKDRLVKWLSPLWHPPLAGEPVHAADVSPQEQVFYVDDGEIRVTCEWRASYQDQPAIVRIGWQARVTFSGDFWVRFIQLDDARTMLAEVRLGSALEGEALYTADVLGFDPTRTPWSLTLLVKEPQG
jgi:hypothetical protein